MAQHVWSVLLAGGIGSRFWPVSRALRPKQLLDLFGEGPMLRATLERALPLAPAQRTIVVTSESLAPAVRALMPEVPADQILAEPSGKNTAPAIAWAAKVALAADPDARLMVLPADHHIVDVAGFRATVERALVHADEHLVTIGIVPTRPETAYGYIRRGAPIGPSADDTFEVAAFVEKPDLPTALGYLAGGEHLWNAGQFFMSARLFLDELALHRPALAAKIVGAQSIPDIWPELESVSIDYAVLERSKRIAVVPGSFGWSDVGSWRALEDHMQEGAANFASATVDLHASEATGNVFYSETPKVIAAVGIHDLIVVDTPDALLILPKDRDQEVKDIVEGLKRKGAKDLL